MTDNPSPLAPHPSPLTTAGSFVKIESVGGIATITVNRPEVLNNLNPVVLHQLHRAVDEAITDPAVRGIVIGGEGKVFVVGADIDFFIRNLDADDIPRIIKYTEAGHGLMNAIDRSPKPVVARLNGAALGGGLELALACDVIIASPAASVGFPETGLGIYPGFGGTQRASRRVGLGLAKWMIFTGKTLSAFEAQKIGLVQKVVPPDQLDEVCHCIALGSPGEPSRGPIATDPAARLAAATEAIPGAQETSCTLSPEQQAGTLPFFSPLPSAGEGPGVRGHEHSSPLSPEHQALEAFFTKSRAEDVRSGTADTGGDAALGRAMKLVAGKAPIALRLAEKLIEQGFALPLEAGLQLEIDHVTEIFSTQDCYTGLAFRAKRQLGSPTFVGK